MDPDDTGLTEETEERALLRAPAGWRLVAPEDEHDPPGKHDPERLAALASDKVQRSSGIME